MILRKDAEVVQVETKELSPLSIIKTEANLAGLPFFALSRQDRVKKIQTEYRTVVEREGKRLEVSWNVTANAKHGYPGPFDRKVHKAIEYIINEQGIPIENPVPFSIYRIIKILELNSSGRTRQKIRQSLVRIFSASVTSEGTFYSKTRRQYISDNFHIYDRVVFKEQTLPNGEKADTNYVFLSQWYLDSINAFYVRPIDFNYFRQLRGDIAGRLYELLSLKFFGVLSNQKPYWKVEYEELCSLLPIAAQKYLSDAKRYLRSPHRELIETQFLSKALWSTKDKGHWYILYYPGERAREEFVSRGIQEQLRLEAPHKSLVEPEQPVSQDEADSTSDTFDNTPDQKDLLSSLIDRGVGKRQAFRLVKDHRQWIKRAIELWELERKKNPKGMKNPAGYLVSIVEAGEDWQPPGGYVSSENREQRKREQEAKHREEARIEEEKARRDREQKAAIEKVLSEMTEEELSALKEEVLARADDFHKRRPSYEAICEKDIREWGDEDLTEIYLRGVRDQVIRDRV